MYSSLYIHVPFCAAKCDYCAFYSECDAAELHGAYLARLDEEMAQYAHDCLPLTSIFVGGGTPSMLSVAEWRQLFASVRNNFTLVPGCEISSEANPESLRQELIECWRELGVNRVSLGIQAFKAEERMALGRRGTLDRLEQLVSALDAAGIVRRNFDLIYNFPGHSLQSWRETLHRILQYNPTHLSTYELSIEEGTPLAKRHCPHGDEELFLQLWQCAEEELEKAGFHRYEISNFALPGEECRHNLDIWRGGTYLGCGPAAWSFDGRIRRGNVKSLSGWLQHAPQEVDDIPYEERAAEILAFGMRVVQGWQWSAFRECTGYDALSLREKQLEKLQRLGLVEMNENGTFPTRQGLLLNDTILTELI